MELHGRKSIPCPACGEKKAASYARRHIKSCNERMKNLISNQIRSENKENYQEKLYIDFDQCENIQENLNQETPEIIERASN